MQQQGIRERNRASISIATKLLVGMFALVVLTVAFLNLNAIVLVTEDKRAYLFQSQANEAYLLGKDFAGTLQRSIDALRLALAESDPSKELSPEQRLAVQAGLNNQSTLLGMRIGKLNVATQVFEWSDGWVHASLAAKAGFETSDLTLHAEMLKDYAPLLAKRGLALLNVSQVGRIPLVTVIYADRGGLQPDTAATGVIPLAAGFLAIPDFSRDLRGSRLTIASLGGDILFDTDPATLSTRSRLAGDPLFDFAAKERVDTGTREYETGEGKFIGSYFRPGFDIVVLSRASWSEAMAATYALTEKFMFLGIMALALTVIFSLLFAKRLTAPINRLYVATQAVSEGNFNVELESRARDEIGVLTRSFVAMSRKIGELIQESMRKVHLENELAIASAVQQTLIPPPHVDTEQVKIRSLYRSAEECGGDWWGFFSKGDKVYVMIADATGHGLPSALITAAAQSCASTLSKLVADIPDWNPGPGELLSIANRAIYNSSNGKINMTFFVAELDFRSHEIVYASAGHNPPWLFTSNPDQPEAVEMKSLVATGDRLGEQREVPRFKQARMSFRPGDIFFFYTDGVLEARNASDEMFGKKRASTILKKAVNEGPAAMIADLEQAVMLHNGDKPLDDDITLVAVQAL